MAPGKSPVPILSRGQSSAIPLLLVVVAMATGWLPCIHAFRQCRQTHATSSSSSCDGELPVVTKMPAARKSHAAHKGEIALHKRLGFPPETSRAAESFMEDNLGGWGAEMIEAVPFTLVSIVHPASGVPLPTVLFPRPAAPATTPNRAAEVPREDTIEVDAVANQFDPVVEALRAYKVVPDIMFAGQAMDFEQRSRNKYSGYVRQGTVATDTKAGDGWVGLRLTLAVTESMGNCPKYITRRRLRSAKQHRTPTLCFSKLPSEAVPLSAECVATLEAASTVFLATKHTNSADPSANDAGLNHRGGPPGFVRLYTDPATGVQSLVLPDYSGNRLMQSLGNVETDPVAGVMIMDFVSGSLLYVTGAARNCIGDDARRIMPRSDRITMITVESARLIGGAIPLDLVGPEEFSLYNPPVRYLATESASAAVGVPLLRPREEALTAQIMKVTPVHTSLNRDVCLFDLKLSEPITITPGAAIVLNCAPLFPPRAYRHMNEGDRQSLNDDLVRTWTVVAPQSYVAGTPTDLVSLLLRRKHGGAVTPALFTLDRVPPAALSQVRLPVLGFTDGMQLPSVLSLPRPLSMLWIAAGIGLTPFITFSRAMASIARSSKTSATGPTAGLNLVAMVTYRRGDDPGYSFFSESLAALSAAHPTGVADVAVRRFLTTGGGNGTPATEVVGGQPGVVDRRLTEADIVAVPDIASRECYICGPPSMVESTRKWLAAAGVEASRVHVESFAF